MLGYLYSSGIGVKIDLEKAEEYYIIASQFGEWSAKMDLANWYRDGIYYAKDHSKAKLMYEAVLNTEYAEVYMEYALLLATSPLKEVRNGKKAVEYAEKATSLILNEYYLESLSAAYAANKQFDDAVRIQMEYIEFLETENELESLVTVQKGYLQDYRNFVGRYDYY